MQSSTLYDFTRFTRKGNTSTIGQPKQEKESAFVKRGNIRSYPQFPKSTRRNNAEEPKKLWKNSLFCALLLTFFQWK